MIYQIGGTKEIDISKVGGKSYHLNYLKYNGFPVPDGLILDNRFFYDGNFDDVIPKLNKNKTYAVRSSAIDEDGTKFSFAGLQDTYLNVVFENIEMKIKECYQSQFSARASEYRKKFGIEASRGMSVIVQEMVDADFAGVIFTQNPINNRIDEVMIEVIAGLGDKLVSGHKTPSTYTVGKNTQIFHEKKIHEVMPDADTILELLEYALKIEQLYGCSQDIEFAVKDNKIFILQSRPITTVTRVPMQKNDDLRMYVSFGHVQNMTYPITPVGAEMIQKLFSYNDHLLLKDRVIYNKEFLFIDLTDLMLTPSFIFNRISKSLYNISNVLPELAIEFRKLNKTRKMLPLKYIKAVFSVIKKVVHVVHQKDHSRDAVEQYLKEYLEKYKNYTPDELILHQSDILFPLFSVCIPYIGAGMLAYFKVKKMYKQNKLDMNDFNQLMTGVSGNVTTEMGLLYDDVLTHYGTKKGEVLFNDYIKKYGMRVDGEIDVGRVRPSEDIAAFKEKVKEASKTHSGESLRKKHEKQKINGQKIVEDLQTKLSVKKYKKLCKWIHIMQTYMVLREHPKYTVSRIFELYRKMIDNPFITLAEKFSLNYDESEVKNREKIYAEAFDKKPPLAMCSNGLILKKEMQTKDGQVIGFGVSSGMVTGTVRIIEHLDDGLLKEGEILVTRFTDPGWTPLLAKASGLITEVGGMMTHGAIVAREYGIPAVVSVDNAVELFHTGDQITINGDTGYIEVIKNETT